MALREILAHFGVSVESEKLESFDHRIGEVTEKLKQFGEIVAASFIGEKLHEFVEQQIQAGAQLKYMSERLGVTTDDLQSFQLAAQLSGASAEDAATGLRFFNRALGNAKEGGESAKVFKELHVDMKELNDESVPLVDKVAAISEGFGKLKTHGEKTAYAMKLFGRGGASMIPMLEGGKEGVKELFEEFDNLGGGMSKDFVVAAKRSEEESAKLKFALTGLKSRIAMELMPGITAITQKFTKWIVWAIKLSKQTNVLKTALIALKLGAIVGIISKIVKVMGMAEGGTWGFIKSLLKFGPIVLLVLALYLIFDDLFTMMTGGDSVIAGLIDELFGIGTAQEVVESLNEAYHDFIEWLDAGGSDMLKGFARGAVMVVVEAFDLLLTIGKELGEVFNFVFDTLAGKLTDADKDLKNMGKHFDDFTKHGDKMADWVNGKHAAKVTDMGDIDKNPPVVTSRQALSSVTGAASVGAGGAAGGNKIVINNNISGVSDPKEAGKHAGKATQAGMGKALRDAHAAQPTGAE